MKGIEAFWEGHPENELGAHDGWSDKKRPNEKK